MELENREICAKCGGFCCKKSGCDYIPSDFENMSINYLVTKLEEGKISIVSALKFERLPNGKIYVNPFLYLRARNTNRPIVDLFSLKTKCSQLTDNGCRYDISERPSGGVNLIPDSDFKCLPKESPIKLMSYWESYQKVLSKLVKRLTGYSVEEKLKLDVINVLEDLINGNFEDVSPLEIMDIRTCLPELLECYGEYYNEVKKENIKLKIKI